MQPKKRKSNREAQAERNKHAADSPERIMSRAFQAGVLKRGRAEKRRAVEIALKANPNAKIREIARIADVSWELVSAVKYGCSIEQRRQKIKARKKTQKRRKRGKR